jgi:sigma-B regulation protein RsbU (phosphoserine phosphatase)
MTDHVQANRQEYLEEIQILKNQLHESQRVVRDLKDQIKVYERDAVESASKYAETVYELELAKLIVEQSPVVLFRRRAGKIGDKPTIEYISDNLIQFGYEPRELMEDEIRFKDIVHPDDRERLLNEISQYVDDDVEEYTQYYRAVTKSGDIRWKDSC